MRFHADKQCCGFKMFIPDPGSRGQKGTKSATLRITAKAEQNVKNLVRKALVLTCVLASLALASLNISSSSSSMSLGSGRAGFVSGLGSISPTYQSKDDFKVIVSQD
jgi:hypothetical protein